MVMLTDRPDMTLDFYRGHTNTTQQQICLRSDLSWFNWWVSLLRNFSVAISVSPHVCFILVLFLISMIIR